MHNKTLNKTSNQSQLLEGLQFKDLDGMMKSTIHVDEFSSKMGDDEDIIVVSFFVRSKQAARDLMAWFEKGYDFVLDADTSPGEIKPNRYLVYVEMRRRSTAGGNVEMLLDDLSTLTEFKAGAVYSVKSVVRITTTDFSDNTDEEGVINSASSSSARRCGRRC